MVASSTENMSCPECGVVLLGVTPSCGACGAPLRLTSVAADARRSAWLTLFGATALAAGHGIFLLFAVTRERWIPTGQDLGGGKTAWVVALFLVAPVGMLAALVFRRRLLAWRGRALARFAIAVALMTGAMFVAYLVRISQG